MILGTNISLSKAQTWVDDFPAFPFGGIRDRSLEGNDSGGKYPKKVPPVS